MLRSLLITLVALWGAWLVQPLLARRQRAWLLLVLPYLTPALLVGYGYAHFSLSLLHHPQANTWFYGALVTARLMPLAALVLFFTPAPLSAAAIHLHRLQAPTRWAHWWFLVRAGQSRAWMAAGALVFLLAFAEFELASLLGIKTWTVKLFDAQAGGLPLVDSLRLLVGPLLVQLAPLLVVVALLARARPVTTQPETPQRSVFLGWLWLGLALALVTVVPAVIVLRGTWTGFGVLLENFALWRELGASVLLAGLATVLTWGLARARWSAALAALGLFGPLVLALLVLAAIQLPGLWHLRETPLPVVATVALVLLPYSVVLRRLLQTARPGSALHLARFLERGPVRRELVWHLQTRRGFWVLFVLFVWAYWDLTAAAILAPIRFTPVTVRLYNLMHYGQTAVLSALVMTALVTPLVVLALGWVTRRWWART